MIKSTASAGQVELQSAPSAYYLWEFPEKPVSVRVSLDVVERLERDVLESFRAITARGSEVGGLLLGRSEAGPTIKTIVENYELFHCDYTRGPLYLLSNEEKARLEDSMRRKKAGAGQGGAVVGFFRSNTRKDLALDDEDLEIFGEYFARPEQAFLLVKPFAAKASVGGIFIWEDGKVRSEGSYIEFPFRRSELGKGDFAKSIVIDTPKPKESPAEAPIIHKTGSRAMVLPFSLKRDEEPPVAAPPLKKEERAPVVALSPKPAPVETPVQSKALEPTPAPVEPTPAVEPTVVLKTVEKAAPATSPQRAEHREEATEEKKEATRKEAPAAKARPQSKADVPAQNETLRVPSFAGNVTAVSALPARSIFGGKKLWALFGGLIMLGLAGGTLYYLQSHATAKSGISARDAANFQLKAERSGGQLLVTWNRQSDAIQAAQSAVLSINDGAKTEDVSLDLAQLHAGSIMYSPLSGDVSFRLEVNDGKAGKIRSEFVHAPIEAVTDPAPKNSSNDAAKPSSQQAQLTPAAQQQAPQKPVTPEAARIETNAPPSATDEAAPTPKPAGVPPKPFSLAARIRQPEPSELPEAPSVGSSASSLAVRPGTLSRLPAPPPPPPQVQATQSAPATHPPATPLRTRGTVQEPKLLRRVDAAYPPMARQARVGGVVRIQATIGADGKVKKIEVRSGPPLLRQAAIDAVQKWVYSPSLLNGSPVEAKADVDVNFNLNSR